MASKYALLLCLQCVGSALVSSTVAQTIVFDFDNAPLQTSLPLSLTVSGLTAHFSATGQGYSIQEANVLGFTPQGFAGRVIYPNSIYLADLHIKFDARLADFSVLYSCQELGCDDAATMRVTAYRSGNLVGTNTKTASNPGTWPSDILRCSFPQGFDSVVIHYDKRPPTCQDYGVIFMADNMQVTVPGALPVTLSYFRCSSENKAAVLQWKSENEINLDSYLVQSSSNGRDFRELTRINAQGNQHEYCFVQQQEAGTTYYRLKLNDRDGSCQYSEIKMLRPDANTDVTIVPNPSSESIQVYANDNGNGKTIQILSINGFAMKTIPMYSNGQKVTVHDLPTGLYILKVIAGNNEVLGKTYFLKL